MPPAGSNATASCAKRPALRIGSRSDCAPAGTSKMYPCGCWRLVLGAPVKSAPTSGPLTVSSHVIQLPQGIGPPIQFIWVPFRLVNDSWTLPRPSTSVVVVPPAVRAS